jgi:hypothetical protein
MRDWWELNRLMTRYAAACDTQDWTAFRAIFSDDALIDYSEAYGRAGGIDEIATWMPTIMDPSFLPHSQHMLANLTVEVIGEEASGQSYYFNPDVLIENGAAGLLINGGRYRFAARRKNGVWMLTRLNARLFWSMRAELCRFDPQD